MKRLAVFEGLDIDISDILFRIEMIEYYEDYEEFRAIDFISIKRKDKENLCFIATLEYYSETENNTYEICIHKNSNNQFKINIIIESMKEDVSTGDEYIINAITDMIV